MADKIKHPNSGAEIHGTLLDPATSPRLQATDLYASTNGTWQQCPTPGLCLEPGCATLWVRP